MTKWIADFEVNSHLAVSSDDKKLIFQHPEGIYDVHIKNSSTKTSDDFPLLSVQVIFECENIKETKNIAKQYLGVFLDGLTFVTNQKFTIHELLRIVDWTPGLAMRECYQFKRFKEIDSPMPFLEDTYLDTLSILLKGDISQSLRRVLKWFSKGISSTSLDDQFQYFWFVIELLAEAIKPTDKIADKCPKCQEPLFCNNCQNTPTHRPYPKQAIQHLIQKYVTGDSEILFKKLSKVRNAIMHGDEIKKIEKDLSLSLEDVVNTIGRVSWTAILNSFIPLKETADLHFIEVNKYVHHQLVTFLHMKMGCPDKDNPQIEKMPMVEISMVKGQANDTKNI